MCHVTAKTVKILPEGNKHADLLRAAFDQIRDPSDWKNPINAVVPWDTANVYMQAIVFMTGTRPRCEKVIVQGYDCAHLTSIGYRAGPAGDH